MVRDVLGIDMKRVFILLAVMAAVLFAAISLMPGEPAAQTASTNGKIAYLGYDVEMEEQHLYTMNPDGTGVTNLTRRYTDPNWSPLGNAHGNPEWSPDGTKISFTGTALSDIGSCCSRNVYVMDADGANLRRLTTSPSTRCVLHGLAVEQGPSEPSAKGISDGPAPAYPLARPPGRGSDRALLSHR